ncbi:unnamed protein product [Pedinophyceae sp. YPF-701]|nr:unnamed protein product [Pedinophyceae sp. YPF-701]CAG9464845.1 unnamed protein product [Pedinophyceae sp. YPF-701]
MLNWQGSGMSVMEMSHRGKEYDAIHSKAQADLRELMGIPDNYKVLFVQGGASTQFAGVVLNLTKPGDVVDYVVTGSWGKKALQEAEKLGCKANLAAKGDNKSLPPISDWKLSPDSKFVHICSNETIQGVEFQEDPDLGDRVLVADMSSNILSKPVDVSKYGVIYCGAQKNIGPSGVTIVIVREDLIGNARPDTPTMLDWKTMADNDSLYNTPPCYSIYICGLVFAKLLREGGLAASLERNKAKAGLLYDAIDASGGFYNCPVDPAVRSNMNVPFTIPGNPELEPAFIKGAAERGMVQLKGHRSVGGMRASIYNAMPHDGCGDLAAYMKEFQQQNA